MFKRAMWTMGLVLGSLVPAWAMPGQAAMPPARWLALHTSGQAPLLLDVRTPREYREGHIAGALNVPVDQIAARHGALHAPRDQPIVVYCRSGTRAARAKAMLDRLGYAHVRLLEGSILAWQARHLPLVREPAY